MIALVTGATSGLGLETARQLARRGAHVILGARTHERGGGAAASILAGDPAGSLSVAAADLSTRHGVRSLADQVRSAHARVDVLVNNAGAVRAGRHETADGLEWSLAVNHLAPFLLTRLLLPLLTPHGRIVVVTSDAHRDVSLDFDDLQLRGAYDPLVAYRRSKLANVLFARALAGRVPALPVIAVAPGLVDTGIVREAPPALRAAWSARARSAQDGARTIVEAASGERFAAAGFFYVSEGREIAPSADACDEELAERLWEASAVLTATPASPAALDEGRASPTFME